MSIFDTDIQPIQQDPEFDRLRGLAESIKAESGTIGGAPVEPTIDINAYMEDQLSASLYDAALVNPAEYAEKARLGKAIDVDPDIIGPSNIDFAKQEKLVNGIDVPRLLKEYPVTSAFLVNNANVAQTSVNKMTALEQILGLPAFIGRSGLAGVYGLGGGLWGAAHGVLQNVNAYGAKPLYEAFTGRPGKENDDITSWFGQQAEGGKQLFHETLPKENTAVAMGIASTTMFFGSLLASFGNPGTALQIMSVSAGGSAYEEGQDADLEPFQSAVHGVTQGSWEYLTENTPLTRLFKDLKIGEPLWNMILHQFKLELIGESLSTLAGSFTDWADINRDHSFESFTGWLKGLPEEERQTAISTFVSVGTTTTLMHGVQKVIDKGLKVQHAKDMGQVNDVIQNMIQKTDMATVAPEAMSEFLNQLSGNKNPAMSNVFIDPVRLTEALSTSGSSIDDLVEIYPDIKKQMKEDPLGVNDISIPAGTYHAMIAPKFGAVLNEHVKYGVDQLSLFELPEAEQEQARLMEEAGVALDAKTEERKAFQASAAEVKTLATEQIKEATKGLKISAEQRSSTIAAIQQMTVTAARRLGVTPMEAYERVVSKIVSGESLEEGALEQPGTLTKSLMIDGVQRPTVNSEGNYLADTEEGVRNFWAWFGNSVVVEGKGNPRVVYHGTEADFDAFEESTAMGWGKGVYFSTDRADTEEDFGPRVVEAYIRMEKPVDGNALGKYEDEIATTDVWKKEIEKEREWYGEDFEPDMYYYTTEEIGVINEALRELGYDGIIGKQTNGLRGNELVVFSPEQIKSTENVGTFSRETTNILRQQSRGSWNPSTLETKLYEGADFTTILHEFSHGFMSMYMKAAEDRDVSPQITEDVQTLLDWFGVKDLTEWNRMSLEEQAPFHEQFSYNWEKYLFGGKAPSTKLQKIFDKFTKWVKDMYNGYVQQLNTTYKNLYGKDLPGMTPEVKGVFDRMLASEAQIDQVMQAEEMKAAFGVKPDGMTDAQWAEYEDMLQEVRDEAVHKLTAAALRELKWLGNAQGRVLRELQGQAKKARDKVKKEITEDIENRPVYVLARFLKTGVLSFHGKDIAIMPGGGMGPGVSAKISLSAVKGMFPPGKLSQDINPMKLGTGKNGMLANDGMLPEQIAEVFRTAFPEEPMFTSGEGLVHALLGMIPIKQAIESETDQRMLQEHSELLDKDSLDLKVREALHSTLLSKMSAIELKFMSGTLRPVRILTLAARAVAKQMLSKVKVSQLNPRQHAVMANRAGKSARKFFIQKDYQGAARTKQAQLLQNEMMKEALEMRKEISSFLKSVDKYQKIETSKKVGDKATEQIRSILYRFGLTSIAPTVAEEEARRELVQHLMSIEEAGYLGYSSTVPAFIQKETVRIPYSELSIDQMRELIYTIQSLEKIGRAEIADRDATTLGSIANNVALAKQSIEEKVHDPKPYHAEREGALAHGTKSFMWYNMSLASIVRILDGDVDNGPLFRMLMTPANEAGDMETRMRAEAGAALEESFKKVYGQQLFKNPFAKNKIFIEELKGVPGFPDGMISRPGLVMIAANCGNMDNINRLLAGTGLDQKTLLKVLGNLTKDEANMVQEIWDYYETFRPLIAEQSRKRIGREPKWTVAVPITINTVDGPVDLAGGHFPIRYDNSGVTPASADVDTEGSFGDPMVEVRRQVVTSHGFDMERSKEGLGKPLLLDPSTIFLGINEVIHDLSWRDVLIQSNKIINNTTFKNTVVNAYGANMHNQMTQWIHDVAIGNQVMTSGASRFYHTVSHNLSFSRMALSMTTLVKQPLGLIQSMPGLGDGSTKRGAGRLMQGLIQYMADPVAAHRVISEGSDFMKYRGSTLIRDLNELRNVLHGESGFMKMLKVNGFVLIAKAQSIVDAITWIAAYNKNAAVYGAKQAGQVADQVVKSAQGSGLLHDMPASMRSEGGMRLFTAFYSYRNATFQRLMVSAKTKGVLSGSFATEAATLLIVQVLAEGLLMEILSGDDDDDENVLVRAGEKLPADAAAYSLGLLPVFGEVTALGQILFGAEGEYTPRYTGPSRLALFSDIIDTATQLRQGEFDRALRKGLISLAGDVYGIPSAQINRSWDGIEAWLNDDIESSYDVPTAILFGPRR